MLRQVEYKGFNIFYYENKYVEVGKKIIENDYKTIKVLKDTKRNYVSAIEIDGNNYIVKEPRNEYIIPQRKLMSFFKKGEALTTLMAITKRRNGMIVYSLLLMERVVGTEERNLEILVNLMKKIHKKGFYHGDFNPSNFLNSNGNIFILDTQGKKMFFGNYRAHYDMLTMKMDSYKEMEYPYLKNIFYYFALLIKKIKKLPLVEKIKKYKKKLREKGWKI